MLKYSNFKFYRIHYVVGNACVKMWATKIISEFQNYLQAGEEGIESRCKYLADAIAGVFITHSNHGD